MASSSSSSSSVLGEGASANEDHLDKDNRGANLDDDTIEKIIAKLPFKKLFQAQSLSKTWQLRFHSPALQSEVQRRSATTWPSYAPVFVNHEREAVGYESSSQSWLRLPSHPDLQQDMLLQDWCLKAGDGLLVCWMCNTRDRIRRGGPGVRLQEWRRMAGDESLWCGRCGVSDPSSSLQNKLRQEWRLRAGEGSLLCWTCRIYVNDPPSRNRPADCVLVFVTNPLTKSCRQLPSPATRVLGPDCVHLVLEGNNHAAYKVVLGAWDGSEKCMSVQVFDSGDGSWTQESCRTEMRLWGGSAVVNGVFYAAINILRSQPWGSLLSFDLEEKVWREKPLSYFYLPDSRRVLPPLNGIPHSEIVVCGANVMMVMFHQWDDWEYDDGLDHPSGAFSVFTLDLERGFALEVSRVSNRTIIANNFGWAAGFADDCIYIGDRSPAPPSLVYNVGTQKWHHERFDSLYSFTYCHPDLVLWTSVTYQPGLNPFLEV